MARRWRRDRPLLRPARRPPRQRPRRPRPPHRRQCPLSGPAASRRPRAWPDAARPALRHRPGPVRPVPPAPGRPGCQRRAVTGRSRDRLVRRHAASSPAAVASLRRPGPAGLARGPGAAAARPGRRPAAAATGGWCPGGLGRGGVRRLVLRLRLLGGLRARGRGCLDLRGGPDARQRQHGDHEDREQLKAGDQVVQQAVAAHGQRPAASGQPERLGPAAGRRTYRGEPVPVQRGVPAASGLGQFEDAACRRRGRAGDPDGHRS